MTIFFCVKFKTVTIFDVKPGKCLDTDISPALNIFMSTPFEKSYYNYILVGLISIFLIKSA